MHAPEVDTFQDEAAPGTRPGDLVGHRYLVERIIGSGGMGRVVAAVDQDGTPVAIKLLVAPAWRSVLVERFFREARNVSRIDSPHVIKVLSVSASNEVAPYMVMERLEGQDFAKRIEREGPLSLREAADCVMQTCAALACSHAIGVTHRDVKPSNLFDHKNADGSRTVKVLDFGISKARLSNQSDGQCEWTLTTTRDTMLGSPPYMSPEHLRDARSVDHRTDIWSLGVVAYQLLTGRLPFEGKTVGALFCSVLERRLTPLTTVRPEMPRELEAIIDRCLSSDPDDRFQNAADLARAFAPFASPKFAALADTMTTKVGVTLAVAIGSKSRARLSSAIAAARLDGADRTMTVAPVLPPPVAAPPSAAAPAPATPSPFEDYESQAVTTILPRAAEESYPAIVSFVPVVRANANTHAAARRARVFAAAACACFVALLASPFAFSSSGARIEPATAIAVAAAAPAPPPAGALARTPDDEITFVVAETAPVAAPITSTVKPAASGRAVKRMERAMRAIDSRR